jgi:hypothetical protein
MGQDRNLYDCSTITGSSEVNTAKRGCDRFARGSGAE